jgi:hypothetical protein
MYIHYPDSKEANQSFFLMLCALRGSKKYQFHNLWFDQIVAQAHDVPHLRAEASKLTITPPMTFIASLESG